jgi:vitamin-K-epoxide reductase (warfarin-sensitive)
MKFRSVIFFLFGTCLMKQEQLWSLLGIVVSIYSIYVEHHASVEDDFVALCDINQSVSCSKVCQIFCQMTGEVLTSPYARLLGLVADLPEDHYLNLPNTYFGTCFNHFPA